MPTTIAQMGTLYVNVLAKPSDVATQPASVMFARGCPDCRWLLQSQPELGVPIRLLPAFAAVYSCVGQDRTAGSPFVRAGFAAGIPLQGCCQSLRVRERYIGANRP